jgi:hypothetical protein
MQFLKKHYEKVLLSIVLLGLAVAAAALPLEVSHVSQFLQDTRDSVVRTKAKEFRPLNLSTNEEILKRFETPVHLRFTEPHFIFNPVPWKKGADNIPRKVDSTLRGGPAALTVVKIDELNLTVSFEGVAGTPEKPQYLFVVVCETNSPARITQKQTAALNVKNALFNLIEAKPPGAPTDFVLQLKDEKQPIVVSKDKPYTRVIGYAAELRSGNQTLNKRYRVKDTVPIKDDPTETYKIVAMNQNEVVLSADSTQKRTTIRLNSTR